MCYHCQSVYNTANANTRSALHHHFTRTHVPCACEVKNSGQYRWPHGVWAHAHRNGKRSGLRQHGEEVYRMGENDSEELDSVALSTMIGRFGENMIPLVEDLAEWISKLLKVEFTVDNFLGQLDNGVLVCKLAEAVQHAAGGFSEAEALPPFEMKYHKNAKTGTFFARDNVAYFLQWCKQIGVQDSVLFESDGLVLHKQPREVILCLMEVARVAARYGVEPPGLVKLEHEIDGEETSMKVDQKSSPVTPAKQKVAKGFTVDREVRLHFSYC